MYPHEILKYLAEEHDNDEQYFTYQGDFGSVECLYSKEALALAKDIETYYFPKPLYSDDTPIQFGDCFLDGGNSPHILHAIEYRDDTVAGMGSNVILRDAESYSHGKIDYNYHSNEPLKRPKLLDSNGDAVLEGRIVWYKDRRRLGYYRRVEKVLPNGVILQGDGENATTSIDEISVRYPDSEALIIQHIGLASTPAYYLNKVVGLSYEEINKISMEERISQVVLDLVERQKLLDRAQSLEENNE